MTWYEHIHQHTRTYETNINMCTCIYPAGYQIQHFPCRGDIINIHAHKNTYMHGSFYTHGYNKEIRIHTRVYIHTCAYTCLHTHMRTHSRKSSAASFLNTHTHTHAYIHTHTRESSAASPLGRCLEYIPTCTSVRSSSSSGSNGSSHAHGHGMGTSCNQRPNADAVSSK